MKIAYADCFSGISGDMFLAALLDAGLPLDHLRSQLKLLPLEEAWEIEVRKVQKGALQASQIEISMQASHDHRHYSEIRDMIAASALSPRTKELSQAVFAVLARAEAKVHGVEIEHVHFHEVGAVDSILDIVGAAVGLEYLGIEQLYASALPLGSGTVQTQHGLLPIPAPATLELLTGAGAPTVPSEAKIELVTPTGAAILAALAKFEQPSMRLLASGTGAGRKELPWANVLRLLVGESQSDPQGILLIETNIDDLSPQALGHVMNLLFAAGALDVFFTPIQMKKNRPAVMLSLICRKSDETALTRLVLEHTTTFGMRIQPMQRCEAERRFATVQTPYGEVPLKLKLLDGAVIQAAPEYDVCARLAEQHAVPLAKVQQAALDAWRKEQNL
jgi:pyridinium-3,5-bisthiocarboxylic acid mononucleotide nickel chelatase